MSSALIGSKVTSLTSRTPSAQIVVSIVSARFFLVGQGPRSARPTNIGSEDRGQRTEQAPADHLAPGDLGLVDDLVQLGEHPATSSGSDVAPCR